MIGPAGDRDHRLGQVVGQRAKAHALAAGHDDRPVRADHGLQELLEQVEADGTAVGVDDGHGIDAAGAHQLQGGRAAIARRHRQVAAGQDRRDGVREVRAAEERAAQVAVRDDAGQAAVRVDGERDAGGATIHGGHRIAEGRALGDEVGVEGAGHGTGSCAAGRDADDGGARLDRFDDDGAHPDDGPGTDLDVVADARAQADEGVLVDAGAATDDGARRDVAAGTDDDVVLDDRGAVHDGVATDARTGVHDGVREDHGARFQRGTRGDPGRGVDDGRPARVRRTAPRLRHGPRGRPGLTAAEPEDEPRPVVRGEVVETRGERGVVAEPGHIRGRGGARLRGDVPLHDPAVPLRRAASMTTRACSPPPSTMSGAAISPAP